MVKKKITPANNIIAQNRKALYNYEIVEKYEAGIVLLGSEVKTLRNGTCSLQESYIAGNNDHEIELINCYIAEYKYTPKSFNHNEKRHKKLLLHKSEINKIRSQITRKGFTAIPLKMYFNKKGLVKLEIALAKGKSDIDKRQTIKEREWKREQAKLLKNNNIKIK